MIKFFVPGKAAPGGSKRWVGRLIDASDKTKPWMSVVSAYAREAYSGELLTGPLSCTMEFRALRPKGHYCKTGLNKKGREAPYPIVKPDLTKLVRAAEDALTGIIWRDDSQVCEHWNKKRYVDRDPGVLIEIEELQ